MFCKQSHSKSSMQSLRRMFHTLKSQADLVFNNKRDLHKKQEFSCSHLLVDASQQIKVYYRTVFKLQCWKTFRCCRIKTNKKQTIDNSRFIVYKTSFWCIWVRVLSTLLFACKIAKLNNDRCFSHSSCLYPNRPLSCFFFSV